jgi:hypothetical protein
LHQHPLKILIIGFTTLFLEATIGGDIFGLHNLCHQHQLFLTGFLFRSVRSAPNDACHIHRQNLGRHFQSTGDMFLQFFAKWTSTWDEDDEGMKG